jgi:hypothetical protein
MFRMLLIKGYGMSSRPAESSLNSTKSKQKREGCCTTCLLACLNRLAGRVLRVKKSSLCCFCFTCVLHVFSSVSVEVPEGLPFCERRSILLYLTSAMRSLFVLEKQCDFSKLGIGFQIIIITVKGLMLLMCNGAVFVFVRFSIACKIRAMCIPVKDEVRVYI